jgi:hypothetical protein
MEHYSTRDQIIEKVNQLFIFTDDQLWDELRNQVFADKVAFDMTSVGGENGIMTSQEICDTWQKGFEGIDQINHLAGNHLVTIGAREASVFCYATATHYKTAAKNGTCEFVGTYDIHLILGDNGWRVDQFRYNLKYTSGNLELQ